jgi:hypothetical protein
MCIRTWYLASETGAQGTLKTGASPYPHGGRIQSDIAKAPSVTKRTRQKPVGGHFITHIHTRQYRLPINFVPGDSR